MKWLRRKLRNWILNDPDEISFTSPKAVSPSDVETKGMIRIHINKAVNGYTIQALTYKPTTGPGPDWTGELFVVAHGEDYMEVIKSAITLHMVTR